MKESKIKHLSNKKDNWMAHDIERVMILIIDLNNIRFIYYNYNQIILVFSWKSASVLQKCE